MIFAVIIVLAVVGIAYLISLDPEEDNGFFDKIIDSYAKILLRELIILYPFFNFTKILKPIGIIPFVIASVIFDNLFILSDLYVV